MYTVSSIRNVAIKEAVVALVEPEQIVTSAFLVKEFDLYTVKKEYLEFESLFHLVGVRSNFIHALVTYFTVEFTKCHTPLDTSPNAPITHWRRTKFYLKEMQEVEGER
jgi:type I protein arginine methyltransferase